MWESKRDVRPAAERRGVHWSVAGGLWH